MEVRFVNRTNAVEMLVKGKLDIDQAESFENEFAQGGISASPKVVGINLSGIEYIDSSGLGALIKVLNTAKNAGKSLLLFGATPKIQNIFQLARLEKFFTFISPVEFKSKYPGDDDKAIDDLIDSI